MTGSDWRQDHPKWKKTHNECHFHHRHHRASIHRVSVEDSDAAAQIILTVQEQVKIIHELE